MTESWGAPAPAERDLLEAVLARLDVDRTRYSDVFEPSLSWDSSGLHRFRFSYAFPGFRSEPEATSRSLETFCQPLGKEAVDFARRVLTAGRHPVIEQVLFGYARSVAGPPRVKFYLQARQDAGPEALRYAKDVLRLQGAPDGGGLPLHLIGLDTNPSGLIGVKLYFWRKELPGPEALPWLPGWDRPIQDALLVYRLTGPGRATQIPEDLDFALPQRELSWPELARSPALDGLPEARSAIEDLSRQFPVRIRRISLARPPVRRLTLYYALEESDT